MNTFIKQEHRESCVAAIQTLVSIPSVLNEGENGTPFGQAIQDALEKTLQLTEEIGFRTYIDPEGYYGYAEIGEGRESLAVLCHLDVVPAGDLSVWETDPFEAVIKDGHIIGRGTQDDKGPSMAALYAVKSLIDAGVTFNKRIRFIFGTDEETLWRCLAKYGKQEEVATLGFAPDSSFPLTYAEKGLLQAKLIGKGNPNLALELGDAYNVVPGKAKYDGEQLADVIVQLDKHGFAYDKQDDGIVVLGESRHSKDAHEAKNAIVRLAIALNELVEDSTVAFIATAVGEDATGARLFGTIEDEPSGPLTFNVAGVTITSEYSEIRLDIRIPVLADKDALVATLTKVASEYGLEYQEYDYLASLYVPLDSELVSTLMAVYRDKTGDMTEPMSSGGATYARTMSNCVAFGAAFPHTLNTEHQENERMPLEDLYSAMDIYAEAIYRLAGVR
ncbi:MAG: dipeptidase [Aerococcaceae bacterium]|nr:dipeptidase [Aerococcaceae bacterium]